jgi:hypothetical protein
MEAQPQNTIGIAFTDTDTNDECSHSAVVAMFIDLLGSSSGQLDDNGEALKECLSPTLQDDDVVCFLPSFRITEKEEDSQAPTENAPTKFWNSLERGVRSVLHMPIDDNCIDDGSEKSDALIHEQENSFDRYTMVSVSSAPRDMLRKLQEAFRMYSHSRLNEWKVLLEHHDSKEAKDLAKLLKYHKMIVGCRGNTSLDVTDTMEQPGENDTTEILSVDETTQTEDSSHSSSSSTENQSFSLNCRLQVQFFVKLRHGPRSFGTSSFTLAFDSAGIVRCK